MKLFASLLLLAAGASAFTAPTLKTKSSSALYSDLGGMGVPQPDVGSWDIGAMPTERIEGSTRRTWNFKDVSKEIVQVAMKSEGRPMNADIELWIGPDWTPMKLKSYSEDGKVRPVKALIGTRNKEAMIEVRNTGSSAFPINAGAAYATSAVSDARKQVVELGESKYVEGGAVYTVPFDSEVNQVEVMLYTDTRQLSAKVELLNGPNNIKQVFEVFTNNGLLNSLYVIFETPGGGNTVRVINTNTVEFPCKASILAKA